MPEALAPAYYAARTTGWRRDVWALLHPPYTAWHLSYVLIGASLAPTVSLVRLIATLLAFFLAVGIAAHALDELRGRPLQRAEQRRFVERDMRAVRQCQLSGHRSAPPS